MPTDDSARDEIEELIRLETRCLNQGDLDTWMSLFTEDGYYWMPLEEDQSDPDQHDSLIYDNRALMEMRRNNLGHPLSPSMQQSRVRSVRVLSDLEISPGDSPDSYSVTAWVIAMIFHRRQDSFAGTVTYDLVRSDTGLKIRCKRVDLINAEAPLDAIMMYV